MCASGIRVEAPVVRTLRHMRRQSRAYDISVELARHSRRGVIRAHRLVELGVPETTVYRRPEQVLHTARRRTTLLESGLYVVSTRPVQTRDDEETVAREIRAGQAIAASMPRPLLRFEPDIRRAS